MGLGPAQGYLAKYNTYTLPGYVQEESFDSILRIAQHYAPYADGSESESMGLQNKMLSLTLKVWEQDYLTCKNQVQQAATILRSKKDGFGPLYVQYSDRYYSALVSGIKVQKTAGNSESVRTLNYQIDFECKPWLIDETVNSFGGAISSPATITTTGRTIDDGGWTPTTITVTGTNVTISGYTDNGDFTGFVSISGAVSGMIIDSDSFTTTLGGNSAENYMRWIDYRTYVGPEVTNFYVTGASNCTIEYQNRWYI